MKKLFSGKFGLLGYGVFMLLAVLVFSAWQPALAAAGVLTPSPTPSMPAAVEELHPAPVQYTFSADLDYDKHTLVVSQEMDYRNETGDTLEELLLVVPPNRRREVFDLQSITYADGTDIETYRLRSDMLQIYLEESLQPQESIGIRLNYILNMPYLQAPFGYTFRQMNFGDWYPFAPPYHKGKGWLVNEIGKVGEYLVYELADYDVQINLVGKKGITIAAPAPAEAQGSTFRYRHKAARNFAWSASPRYEIVWSTAGDVSIMGYVFPEHVEPGKSAAGTVADAMTLFSEMYSPYPRDQFTFVEADFADGMEYDGLYFLDRVYFEAAVGGTRSGLTALSVHETSHQWWGQRVSNNQAMEPWLDEALATYHEFLYYEKRFPFLKNWWWNYRVDFFNPTGMVNANIYRFSEYRGYVNAVYLRGAQFMHDLRAAMGDEDFFAFLERFEEKYRNKQITAKDFFVTLTETSDAPIQDVLDEYFQK